MTERSPRLRLGPLDYIGWRYPLVDDEGVRHEIEKDVFWDWGGERFRRHGRLLSRPRLMMAPPLSHVFAFVLMPCVGFGALLGSSWLWHPAIVYAAQGAFMLYCPMMLFALIAARLRHRSPEYVEIMKQGMLCSVCAYALNGIASSEDGLVTCPECGARWRFASGAPSPGREDAATLSLGGERVQESALD